MKRWETSWNGHTITVELDPGLLRDGLRLLVNDALVAEQTGGLGENELDASGSWSGPDGTSHRVRAWVGHHWTSAYMARDCRVWADGQVAYESNVFTRAAELGQAAARAFQRV